MSDVNQLSDKIDVLQRRMDERYDQQAEFNKGVLENLNGIRDTMAQLNVFQAELNHTNSNVVEIKHDLKIAQKNIADINTSNAVTADITKELRQWKWIIVGSFVAAIIAAIFAVVLPDPQADKLEKQNELIEKLIEKDPDD